MLLALHFLDVLAAVFIAFLLTRLAKAQQRLPLPPGPRGFPLIGNLLQWPTTQPWNKYSAWGRKYGPLTFIRLINRPIIVVNSVEVAFDLLEQRWQMYSDRPVRPLLQWTGISNALGGQPYNQRVQKLRRMIKTVAGKTAVDQHETLIATDVHRFLRRALASSELISNIQLSTGSTILDLNYGYDVLDYNDDILRLLIEAMHATLDILVERASLPEFFPSLINMPSFIPGADFYKVTAKVRESIRGVDAKPFTYTKRQLAAGTARPSFVAEHLSDPQITPDTEILIRTASTSILFAGHETTATGIYNAILAMMLYPEVQAQAQAEIDSVVGSEKLPSLQDRDRLPYVMAVVKESLRWSPPIPEGT